MILDHVRSGWDYQVMICDHVISSKITFEVARPSSVISHLHIEYHLHPECSHEPNLRQEWMRTNLIKIRNVPQTLDLVPEHDS